MTHEPRRKFLQQTMVASGGLALIPTMSPSNVFAGLMRDEFPYYKQGAPHENNLRKGKIWGTFLDIQGIVFREDGKTPLSDATVEIWHCDDKGNFDRFSNNFRGKTRTNAKGSYTFKTIVPGKYQENGIRKMRRIFFLVNADGHKKQFSQLYFDTQYQAYIDGDHWAQSPIGMLGDLPNTSLASKHYTTTYNHVLRGSSLLNRMDQSNYLERSISIYPNPAQDFAYISTNGGMIKGMQVTIRDLNGEIASDQQVQHKASAGVIPLQLAGLKPGTYLINIKTVESGEITKKLKVVQ